MEIEESHLGLFRDVGRKIRFIIRFGVYIWILKDVGVYGTCKAMSRIQR